MSTRVEFASNILQLFPMVIMIIILLSLILSIWLLIVEFYNRKKLELIIHRTELAEKQLAHLKDQERIQNEIIEMYLITLQHWSYTVAIPSNSFSIDIVSLIEFNINNASRILVYLSEKQ